MPVTPERDPSAKLFTRAKNYVIRFGKRRLSETGLPFFTEDLHTVARYPAYWMEAALDEHKQPYRDQYGIPFTIETYPRYDLKPWAQGGHDERFKSQLDAISLDRRNAREEASFTRPINAVIEKRKQKLPVTQAEYQDAKMRQDARDLAEVLWQKWYAYAQSKMLAGKANEYDLAVANIANTSRAWKEDEGLVAEGKVLQKVVIGLSTKDRVVKMGANAMQSRSFTVVGDAILHQQTATALPTIAGGINLLTPLGFTFTITRMLATPVAKYIRHKTNSYPVFGDFEGKDGQMIRGWATANADSQYFEQSYFAFAKALNGSSKPWVNDSLGNRMVIPTDESTPQAKAYTRKFMGLFAEALYLRQGDFRFVDSDKNAAHMSHCTSRYVADLVASTQIRKLE